MEQFLQTKDHSYTGESFQLLYDKTLDMLVTYPRPEDLKPYYKSESYISHTDGSKTFSEKLYQLVKKRAVRKKVKWITSYDNELHSVLDIGAGTGDFLKAVKENGWKYAGVEPDSGARELATKKDIRLHSQFDDLPDEQYGTITLWHVLEHLPELDSAIEQIISKLDAEGTLFIAVPNFRSWDASHYGKYWAGYDVPRHVWHFSRGSINKIFSKHGMQVVKIKPMIYDSFYVSLLSEKYRTGKSNFLLAFAKGLYSNIKAWRTNEYSSLLYILQKVD